MRLWNLFCEIALFNKVWDWLSGKSDNRTEPPVSHHHDYLQPMDFDDDHDDCNDEMDIYDDLDDF